MYKLFDPDGLLARATNAILNLVLLNILWILCCLPVITAGAATAALYSVLFKMRDGADARVVRRFLQGLRENFKRATAVWLVLLAVLAVCGFDMAFAKALEGLPRDIGMVAAMVGLVVAAMVATFVFPLIARYENPWKMQMKNALLLAVARLPRLLLAWLPWAVCIVLTILRIETLYYLLPAWLLMGFSGLHYCNLMIFTPVFRRLETPEEENAE